MFIAMKAKAPAHAVVSIQYLRATPTNTHHRAHNNNVQGGIVFCEMNPPVEKVQGDQDGVDGDAIHNQEAKCEPTPVAATRTTCSQNV